MTNIIQLGGLDDEDKEFQEFLEEVKEGNVKATFILQREDGSIAVGSNATDRRDLVADFYRLQRLIQTLVDGE